MSVADKLKEKVLDLFKKEAPEDQKAENQEKPEDHKETEDAPRPVSSTTQPPKNDLEEVLQKLPEETYRNILDHGGKLLSSIQGEDATHHKDHKHGSKNEHEH